MARLGEPKNAESLGGVRRGLLAMAPRGIRRAGLFADPSSPDWSFAATKQNRRRFTMDTNLTPHQPTLPVNDIGRLRIIVVSDVRFLREGLAEILERDPSVSVVGLSADLPEAVASSSALRPDIVLLDAAYPMGAVAVKQAHDV